MHSLSSQCGDNGVTKMSVRETPGDVFEDVSMDFKGPVGGEYYLHLIIDNLS